MACGCATVLPIVGGADEYAIDGDNSLVIDTLDEELCVRQVSSLIENQNLLENIKLSALLTASKYSVHIAAMTEILHLSKHLNAHRRLFPKLQKKLAVLLPYPMKDGTPSGLTYERIIIPYTKPEIKSIYRFEIEKKLPETRGVDVVIVHRDVDGYNLKEIKHWHDNWRSSESRLIFDIDYQFYFANKSTLIEERIKLLASLADVITTPNDLLAAHFPEIATKVRVIPTVLDTGIWPIAPSVVNSHESVRSVTPVSIGIFIENGSIDGYQAIKNAIKSLKRQYGDLVLFEAVSRERHFEIDVCARVGYPKSGGYFNFIRWVKERIHWDICLIPTAPDLSTGSEYLPSFHHIHAMNCVAVASQVAVNGQDVSSFNNLILIDGEERSWLKVLSKFIEDKQLRFKIKPHNINHNIELQTTNAILNVLLDI
jgi:hypothetical protein